MPSFTTVPANAGVKGNQETVAQRLIAAMDEAGYEALSIVAAEIVKNAIENLPIGDPADDPDPSVALRDSFRVTVGQQRNALGQFASGRQVTISVDTPYAVKQHESFHLQHPRGGGPKFLEKAVLAAGPEMQKQMTESVVRVFKGRSSGTREAPIPDMMHALSNFLGDRNITA